ncbi:MAG TPA: amidohydrolase family protein [Parafilimonas sp.]|nr:amidohydrolase family protein [Parafilimonas sp.]
MSYRKFKADYLFNGEDLLPGNNVLITNESGVIEKVIDEKDAGDNIEIFQGILSPGFINCHCHLELSHLKDVVERGTGLVDFLIKVISNRSAVKEKVDEAIINADNEMYENGIVGVGDICNSTDTIFQKQKSKIEYRNFVEVLGFNEQSEERFQNYIKVYNTYCEAGFEKNSSIIPHAPYTVSNSMFDLINNFSADKIISIHNQETLAEDELYQTKAGEFLKLYQFLNINIDFFKPYNKSSLQSYLQLLDKTKQILLIHNTFTKQADINFSVEQSKKANQKLFWCLCVNANLYIENNLPPVELFRKNNCNIVLGTDSYSSNHSLNILDEIKTIRQNFPSIETKEILQWATLNGAKALGMKNKYGSFEKGKMPGIVLLENLSDSEITNETTIKRLL